MLFEIAEEKCRKTKFMFGGEEMFNRTGNSVAGLDKKCKIQYKWFCYSI